MSADVFMGCERLASAAVNGVYQGMLVAVIAGLALRLFGRANAATCHAIWFGVLLFVTALIPAHVLLTGQPRLEIPTAATETVSGSATIDLAPPPSGNTPAWPAAEHPFPDPRLNNSAAGNIHGAPYFPGIDTPDEQAESDLGTRGGPGKMVERKARPIFTPSVLKPPLSKLETPIRLPHSICLGLVAAWVVLASVRGGPIAFRIAEVRRIKTTSRSPSDGLQTLFNTLRASLRTRRNVRLKISSAHRTAVVLGFVHPVVLLPAEMDNDANDGQIEHVLRHELAHVDRRDDWANLAQQLIQAALFFHPAVWWISAKLSLEREIACDDHVLEASGRPHAYALTLANVASRMNRCRQLLAPGVSNNSSQLKQRITMILNMHRDRSPRLAKSRLGFFTAATAMLAVLAIVAGPRLVLAQSSADNPPASEPASPAPPPPPEAPEADGTPAALPPDGPGSESGPRTKPTLADDYSPGTSQSSVVSAAPTAPATTAVQSMAAVAPVADAQPQQSMAPLPPDPDVRPAARTRHMSVEARLDRIERIVEELEARQGVKDRDYAGDANPAFQYKFRLDPTDSKFELESKRFAEEAKKMADEAQRAADADQRSAQQAMRDMAKKSQDFERSQEGLLKLDSEAAAKELQALRDARETLQRQVESLQQQIKRVQEDMKRENKPDQRPSDDADDRPKVE
jgi:beta-lactamase regulating signal transducer with metallopeptidase domain